MKIVIIGYGVMGKAIADKLAAGKFSGSVAVIDRNARKIKSTLIKIGLKAESGYDNLKQYDVVILAVKPQDLSELAKNISRYISTKTIVVSIAAGVPLIKLQRLLSHKKVVRTMPNLGLSVGQGIAGWYAAKSLTTTDIGKVKKILSAFTAHFPVKQETALDAVTAISGSGAAYFFYLAAVLEKAALALGFDRKQARVLVQKTFSGAASLQGNSSYEQLISNIASKKGTTEAALKVFANKRLEQIINQAVKAAVKRAKELSHE